MHYVIFLGIFGLPFVAAVGMVVTKVLTTFAPQEPPAPRGIPKDDLQGSDSHVSDLVDAFFAAPLEQNPNH